MAGPFDLTGRRAIVTGARARHRRGDRAGPARAGVRVAVADLDLAAAQALAAEIGERHLAVGIDVRERASVESAIGSAIAASRRPRHPLRQCRRVDHAPRRRPDRRGLGLQLRRQCPRHLPDQPDRLPPLSREQPERRHRQHRLARRQGRRAAARPLLGEQVRRARLDAGARPRDGAARHPGQRRLPRLRAHLHAGARDRLGGGAPRHDARGGPRRICLAHAARPDRGARGRRRRRALPRLRRCRAS